MKGQYEIEEVVDALLGHSDDDLPDELRNTANKAGMVEALEWVLRDY